MRRRLVMACALGALAAPAIALAQSSQPAPHTAPAPAHGTKPARPGHGGNGQHRPPSYGNGNYRPVIVVNPNQYLQPPAPAPTKAAAHHAAPKKTSSGQDVFETHSTENQ
jgi:hypothetical protein